MCMDCEQDTSARDRKQAATFRDMEGDIHDLRRMAWLVEIAGDAFLNSPQVTTENGLVIPLTNEERDALVFGIFEVRARIDALLRKYVENYHP